jgi:hypothetical protein
MDKLRIFFDDLTQEFNTFLGYPTRSEEFNRTNWINNIYHANVCRHIHLEYYKTDRIGIVHANIFPDPMLDFPILGLDMIEMGGKITGFFFDLTPTSVNQIFQKNLVEFSTSIKSPHRPLPEWANFFGENFVCITPFEDEIDYLTINSKSVTREYLKQIKKYNQDYDKNIETQNNYCIGQKKNQKTFKALAADIGQESAKKFLNEHTFPEIKV